MTSPETDYERAMRLERAAFLRECPFYFLFGAQVLNTPRQPRRTVISRPVEDTGPSPLEETLDGPIGVLGEHTRAEPPNLIATPDGNELPLPQLFAVRKVQAVFESMVTIGRTQNNDIVIADVQISRFHAFVKVHDDHVELGDAGSRNGTFLKDKAVVKGSPQLVQPGDRIRFAHLAFEFLEAGPAWDRVRALGA